MDSRTSEPAGLPARLGRSLLYYAVGLPSTVWYATLAIGSGLLRVPYRPDGVYDRVQHGWSRSLLWAAGTRVTMVGFEKVPRDRPVVYAANHQSWFDILALAHAVPGTLRFVAKKEMARIPLLGQAMRAAGEVFIDRQNRAQAIEAYEEAAACIRQGLNTVVFPEGTRSRTGRLQPFKKGPFVLALAAQVPLVPVYCAGTFDILPKGHLLLRPHRVTLLFSDPIETAGLTYDDRQALMEAARAAIERLRAQSDDARVDDTEPSR